MQTASLNELSLGILSVDYEIQNMVTGLKYVKTDRREDLPALIREICQLHPLQFCREIAKIRSHTMEYPSWAAFVVFDQTATRLFNARQALCNENVMKATILSSIELPAIELECCCSEEAKRIVILSEKY